MSASNNLQQNLDTHMSWFVHPGGKTSDCMSWHHRWKAISTSPGTLPFSLCEKNPWTNNKKVTFTSQQTRSKQIFPGLKASSEEKWERSHHRKATKGIGFLEGFDNREPLELENGDLATLRKLKFQGDFSSKCTILVLFFFNNNLRIHFSQKLEMYKSVSSYKNQSHSKATIQSEMKYLSKEKGA